MDCEARRALALSPIFSGLDDGDIDRVAEATLIRSYGKGEPLFHEGADATGLHIVAKGQVKVYKVSADGKEHVLNIMEAGQPVGEVALFSGRRYPASADAMTFCTSIFLSRDAFVELVTREPQIALNVIATLSERLRRFAGVMEGLTLKDVPSRLADYLLDASGQNGKANEFELALPKGQLAALLGTVPETISRCFSKMKERGILEMSRNRVKILDTERLRDLASGDKL
jgi:CRP/FNR family transcriptional regulator